MTITYKKGDLFTTDAHMIVHGCNCQGKMGSGIAKQIRDKFPEAYDTYKYVEKRMGLNLGSIQCVRASDGSVVITNALTQEYYGYNGELYTSYDAIRNCFKELNHLLSTSLFPNILDEYKIAMPKIGCGLGGGDWEVVSKIIEEELKDFEVEVWEL